jgi:hypothetical protein
LPKASSSMLLFHTFHWSPLTCVLCVDDCISTALNNSHKSFAPKVTSTNSGGWVLDTYLHLLSCDLMSQSASVTCCTLACIVALFVLHVNIVFMVHSVNRMFMWSKLLVFSIRYTTGVLNNGMRTPQARKLVYEVFSYIKHKADLSFLFAPPTFVCAGHFRLIH